MPSSPVPQILANPSTLGTWFSLNPKLLAGAEIIENKLHLYHDNAVRYLISDDYEFRELHPEPDRQIFAPINGEILLNGDSLEGDTAGNLQIGIYHKNLTYPLEIIDIKLSDSFHVEAKLVSYPGESLDIQDLNSTNEPKNGSKSYPYKLQYSVMTSKQDSWQDTDIRFENSLKLWRTSELVVAKSVNSFFNQASLSPAEVELTKLFQSFQQSPGFKFRLISNTGTPHLIGGISEFNDILLLHDINQKSVSVVDWIAQPNFYDIPYDIYDFESSTGTEEWKSYPKMRAEIANQHLDFANINLDVKQVLMSLSRDGQHLQGSVSLSLDVALDKDSMDELVNTIQFYFANSNNKIISNSHSIIDSKNISLNLKFHTGTHPISKYLIHMDYFSNPNNLATISIHVKKEFISQVGKTFECAIHPDYLSLNKEEFRVIPNEDGAFCPVCGEGIWWRPECSSCGWEDGKPMSQGFTLQDDPWYNNVVSLNGNFQFVLHNLSPGSYKIVFESNTFAFTI